MTTISTSNPQLDFENLIEQVTLTNEPIFISGNNNQTCFDLRNNVGRDTRAYGYDDSRSAYR